MFIGHIKHSKNCMLLPIFLLMSFSSCIVSQQWSENYALMDGTRSNDPSIIDGRLQTVGESQIIRKSGNLEVDLYLPSESIVLLSEKKRINRVIIHSTNLSEFELLGRDANGGWSIINEHKGNHEPKFDITIRPPFETDAIKLVVRGTTDDGAQKRQNLKIERENEVTLSGRVRRGRPQYKVYGPLRATAKIAEIELYGYAEKTPQQ